MKVNNLVLDIDFCDLVGINGLHTPQEFEHLIAKVSDAGFNSFLLDTFYCGTALYHSKILPLYKNSAGQQYGIPIVDVVKKWDPLEIAVKSAAQNGLSTICYFRMLEEAYAPFDGNIFFKQNSQYWWSSRCGNYRYVGWPCYNYPEVREHMLSRLDEVVEHGVTGVLFDLHRTHVPLMFPYRHGPRNDSFGYNEPIVKEFKKRHNIDISKYNYLEPSKYAAHGNINFPYEFEWVGSEQYDPWSFKKLVGEGFEEFFREARKRHPKLHIAVTCYYKNCLYSEDDSADDITCFVDLCKLAKEKIIDEYISCDNFYPTGLEKLTDARYNEISHSAQFSAWLNDFLISDGGGGQFRTFDQVTEYIDHILKSTIKSVWIHELSYILSSGYADKLWETFKRLK